MTTANQPTAELDVSPLFKQFETLPIAVINRIDREKRSEVEQLHKGLPALLMNIVRVAQVTWKATCALAVDKYHRERPSVDFAVVLPPLTRTILESLATVVFVFDAPKDHTDWYYRSGWVEACDLHADLVKRHGSKQKWRDRLDEHARWIELHERDFAITTAEKQKPLLALANWTKRTPPKGWWPNPGKMGRLAAGAARRDFLVFLNSWGYSRLSQDSHLSYMGLARRAGVLLARGNREPYRVGQVLTAAGVLLALLSEVVTGVGLPTERERVRKLWTLLLRTRGDASDLWTARYARLLRPRS